MSDEEKTSNFLEMSAQDIGDALRKTREQQGLTIEDIQERTKLRRKFIQAIEKGEFSVFPGKVYAKGAIRNYAETVNYDYENLWEAYEKLYGSSEEKKKAKPPKREGEYFSPSPRKMPTWIGPLKKVVVYALVIVIAGFGLIQAYEFIMGIELENDEPVAENEVDITEEEKKEAAEEINEKEKEQEKEIEEPPEMQVERVSEDPYTYHITSVTEEALEIVLTAQETSWVGATLDGEYEDIGNVQAGTSETFEINESAEFVLGYAYGVEMTVDETDLEVPEARGRAEVHINVMEE